MATKINVDINVSDNGTAKKSTDAAERLKKTYDAAAKSASKIGASPTMAGAASRATSSAELVEYNRNRALSTGTGASARDFAKQAEGLGGLVRLYATFAANIFAVSAAFGALSSAMDTTNMIRGLDQLGAASGVNLGTLSKRLVEATGGAVSLREAMEATVKASAAGIDSSSILRLGKVAQQASVALGVNASDALNRLSRGVVKLEPELLDELGIFTKIDPAVKKYAESVNKAVSELTDFERRQAFLNAVIEEGEQKFSQIEIDTNPYTKLSAALQNTLQNALELVNKGLGPIAKFLAESPSALTAALTALGAVLIKQALPAIGQVREGLRKSAEAAAEAASGKAGDAVAAQGILQDLLVKQVQRATDEQIQVVDESEKKILALKNGRISKQSALYVLMKKDIQDVEDADVDAAKKQLSRMGNRTEAQKALRLETANYIEQIEKLRVVTDKEFAQGKKQLESTYIYRKVQEDALKFEIKAKQDSIISNAAYTSSLLGPTAGWRRLRAEIELADLSLNRFQKTVLLTRGALAILGGAIGAVADKLGKLFFWFSIITTAWSTLSGLFGSKDAQKLSASLDEVNSSAENLEKTFKKVKDAVSEVGLTAQGNALTEFSNSLKETIESSKQVLTELNNSDYFSFSRITNRIFDFLPFLSSKETELANQLSTSIITSTKAAAGKLPKNLSQDLIEKVFSQGFDLDIETDVKLNTKEGMEQFQKQLAADIKRLASLGDGGLELAKRLQIVAQAYDDIALAANNAASRIKEVKEASKEAANTFNTFVDSYKVKSPLIDFAEKSITVLKKLDTAQKEALNIGDQAAAAEATKAAKDFLTSVGLDPRTAEDINAGVSYFSNLLTSQLAVERKKVQNAFKEYAISLAPDLSSKSLGAEVSIAKAELDKIKAEKEQLDRLDKSKVTPAARQGLETRIQAATNAVLIAQVKEKLAKEKDNLQTLQNTSKLVTEITQKNKARVELDFLSGQITERGYVTEQKRYALEENRQRQESTLQVLENEAAIYKIVLDTLESSGVIDKAEKERRKTAFERLNAEQKARALAEKELADKKASLEAEIKLLDIEFKKVKEALTLQGIYNQIYSIRLQSELDLAERSLELSIRKNEASRADIILTKDKLGLQKIENNEKQRLNDLDQSFVNTQIALAQELAVASAKGETSRVEALVEQIRAQNTLYETQVKAIKEDTRQKKEEQLVDLRIQNLGLMTKEKTAAKELAAIILSSQRLQEESALNLNELRLNALKEIEAVTESQYQKLRGSLEVRKTEIELENRRKDIILETANRIDSIQERINSGGLMPAEVEVLQKQQDELRASLATALVLLSDEQRVRLGILKITTDQQIKDAKRTEEAKKLTDQYKEMANTASLIGDVFDGFGDRFAKTVGGLSSVLQTDLEKRNELEKKYEEKRLKAANDYKDNKIKQAQVLDEIETKYKQDSQKLELENTTKALSAAKTLFKEKTVAFKVLTALEKAAAITTLALNAQVIASNLATLASRVSTGVAQLFAQGGFAGFAASAAFLALMGSLGVFGGKSVKNTSGPSTAQVQEAQTTGQSYSGNILTTRRGALAADPTKTLESIDESLEILKTNSFEELDFSNKNLKTLTNIDSNTKGLSEALAIFALSLPGNIALGTKTSGPFGFGGGVLGKGLSLASGALGAFGGFLGGTAGARYLSNLLLDTFGAALTGIASPLTSIITSAFGPVGTALGFLLGKNLDKVLNSVFGGKTTKTLKDVTLTIDGQLNKLAEANSELIKTFAVLEVKIDGGWFRSDKIFDELFQLETPDLVKEYVGSLFKDIKTGIEVAGSAFGMDITKILETSLTDPIKISLKDLKPEEIADALKNQVSTAFNEIALAGFEPLIKALRDPLEEAGTTLTRLTSQVTLFEQAMNLVGKNVENITGTLKVVVADDLVELLGGVEGFKEKVTFFRENFLTEAEQIAPVAEALKKELSSLGISGTLTRDQFKALVLSQDLATDSGRENYAVLLNVAEAFDKVTSAAEEAQSKLNGFVKDIRDFIREQTLDLVKPSQTTQALFQEFGSTVSKSLQGDEDSLSYLPDIASQTIESARNSSTSLREFNKLRAGIIGSLGEVASKIESGDLKILTPQEQSNVLLEQIVDNTGNLAQDLAKEIDRQAAIREIVSSPEAVADALALTVAQAIQESSYEFSLDPKTVAFLEEERRQQDIADELGRPELGPLSIRMGAVEQLLGAAVPGGSFSRISEAIQTGDVSKLAPDLSKVTLSNLGIKAPSLDEFIFSVDQAAKGVSLAGTYVAAQAINAIDAVKNTVNSLIDAVTGGSAYYTNPFDGTVSAGMSPSGEQTTTATEAISNMWSDPYALGGAFNKGVKMFQSGGAFTNSVVSNPTMFPLGVMGEAGPEAIMPLTRTSDGSLGVQAELPRFSTQQDKTPETLVLELKELRKEMEKVRIGVETTATGTNKTFRLLDRVAQDGDSLNVVTTSNSVVSVQGIKGGSF